MITSIHVPRKRYAREAGGKGAWRLEAMGDVARFERTDE